MRPEFIKIGGIRIRLRDISDYRIDYYKIVHSAQHYTETTVFFRERLLVRYYDEVIKSSKNDSDFGILVVKTYRKRQFEFFSKEGRDLISHIRNSNESKGIHFVKYPSCDSSQEDVDIESTLKKLDAYLS